MKKLEDKIIKKIYRIETKKTVGQIVSKMALIVLMTLSSIFTFSIIVEILNEQASFDLFDFLKDDLGTIKEYFLNNSLLFFQQLPLPLIYVLMGILSLLIWLVFILIKNFSKIKNKLIALYKFWIK